MDRMALNQTAGRIKDAFQLSNAWYGGLESVFTLGFALGTLVTGWLVDRMSVRWVYPAAVIGWSAFGFLTGFAPTYWALFACRLGLGLFEAGNWPCGIKTVRQVMPPAERSLGSAFFQNGTAIGAIVTPLIVLLCVTWADPAASTRSAHLAAGGGTVILSVGEPPANVWQVPFRVIGLIGLGWVVLWVLTVPKSALARSDEPTTGSAAVPFADVLRDRRFWLLVAVVLGVNTSWHTFRVWLPLYLQKQLGYSEAEMSLTSMYYYLVADAGAWAVGFGTLGLTRAGWSIHGGRMVWFGGCTALVLSSLTLSFLDRGPTLTLVLLMYGFGAFGLFPIYFALSQDLSARHQGKVTGTLGCINALYLAVLTPLAGGAVDAIGRYDPIMAVAGLPALVALVLVAAFWRVPAKPAGE
jgi:ACS family hexuronate transporter-like MFS transporter